MTSPPKVDLGWVQVPLARNVLPVVTRGGYQGDLLPELTFFANSGLPVVTRGGYLGDLLPELTSLPSIALPGVTRRG